VKVWDPSSGQELRTFSGHAGSVNSVAFSPDGKMLASASSDKTVRIWNVATGSEMRRVSGNLQNVTCIAFSPDGKVLAGGTNFGFIEVWDSNTGQLSYTFYGQHIAEINAMAFSPDGKTLASGGTDRTVRLWDMASHRLVQILEGHRGSVEALAFSADGKVLASGGRDAATKLWDLSTGQELASLISNDPGNWLVATPDNLFDGSPNSWKEIHWSFGRGLLDVAPLEAFFSDFYYPGLLADILAGRRPQAPREISQKDHRTPRLRLTAQTMPGRPVTTRSININIEVTVNPADSSQPKSAGAKDLRLFRNGSRIKLWPGDILKGETSLMLHASVPIGAGENLFTAYAFNQDNIKSEDASLLVTGDNSLKRSGTFYVLAVGVNEYSNPEYNLKFAAADAQAFGEELKKQQQKLGTYDAIKVIPLLDREATKANILLALRTLAGQETELPAGVPAALRD
jgi:hypothetical protein